jgi:hypothetical protein
MRFLFRGENGCGETRRSGTDDHNIGLMRHACGARIPVSAKPFTHVISPAGGFSSPSVRKARERRRWREGNFFDSAAA